MGYNSYKLLLPPIAPFPPHCCWTSCICRISTLTVSKPMFLTSNVKDVPCAAFPPQQEAQGVPRALTKPLRVSIAAERDCQILHGVMEHPTPSGEGIASESLLLSPPPQHAVFPPSLHLPILGWHGDRLGGIARGHLTSLAGRDQKRSSRLSGCEGLQEVIWSFCLPRAGRWWHSWQVLVQPVPKNLHRIPRHFVPQHLQPNAGVPLVLALSSANLETRLSIFFFSSCLNGLMFPTPSENPEQSQDISPSQRFFPVAIALTTKWPAIFFLKNFRLIWQSMTAFPPETRFQGQNSCCLKRSLCFPWHPNCNSPKGLQVPTAVGIKSQLRPAPPLFQQPHTFGMRLNQYKNKTILSLPGKGGGSSPEKAALYSSQDMYTFASTVEMLHRHNWH